MNSVAPNRLRHPRHGPGPRSSWSIPDVQNRPTRARSRSTGSASGDRCTPSGARPLQHDQHTVATLNMYVNLPHKLQRHACRASWSCTTSARSRSRAVEDPRGNDRELEAEAGHIEMTFPSSSKKAPVSGVEPDGLPGEPDRRASQGRHLAVGQGGRAGHQPLPLQQEDLAVRRAQPALARDHHRERCASTCGSRLIDIAESGLTCEALRDPEAPDEIT